MQVQGQPKYVGLVADLLPNIRIMQIVGHFFFKYSDINMLLKRGYALLHLLLNLFQYAGILMNMLHDADEPNELTANTITTLFFLHSFTKYIYCAINNGNFYRTLGIWNQPHHHPMFDESNDRYHKIALNKNRRLLYFVMMATVASIVSWVALTMVGESTKYMTDRETNETYPVEIPRLMLKSWYPWNAMGGMMYFVSFIFQLYFLFYALTQANLADVLFCSFLQFACEQLQHLKGIMGPLMELSATLDTFRPNSAALFRAASGNSKSELILNEETEYSNGYDLNGVYTTKTDWGAQFRAPSTLQTFTGSNGHANPNGLTRKQEMVVQSAIKYWVERHKHVVRLVTAIGDTYGPALLIHMLTSTITLTLLAYQATRITGMNAFCLSVLGYLCYTLGQVFLFCIFGNRLIEESSSVMEAAYSCKWYDGSEEAKAFVQIVCQQCQKALTISGAKFFTVSLDLFASVLGAVVTYFMVLIQLN